LIEAGAAGCPIVAYDIEWHYELVKNGETGFLIKERDWDALSKAVICLLDHPAEARAMGIRARQAVMAKHDLSHASQVKKDCYQGLLEDRKPSVQGFRWKS
jgi:glycosyltransferase involved in cell wall biosynthesis